MATKTEDHPVPARSALHHDDRRAYRRVPCEGTVELRRIPPAPAESIAGEIRNLSEGGCYLETERPLVIGERLVMEMRLDAIELRLIAEVRSVKTDPNCWAGLEFVGISAGGLEKLHALIEVYTSDLSLAPEPRGEAVS